MNRFHDSPSPLAWKAALALAAFLYLPPAHGVEIAFKPPEEVMEEREEGFDLPQKGELIASFAEDLAPEVEGPETLLESFSDGRGGQVREFRIKGQLFQVEAITYGKRRTLWLDQDGDGRFEVRYSNALPRLVVPGWVLGEPEREMSDDEIPPIEVP